MYEVIGYFGSELNKFVNEKCSKRLTCNNVDCLLIKESKHEMKYIESKKVREQMRYSQLRALKLMKSVFLNSSSLVKARVFIVEGQLPFDDAWIYEIISVGGVLKVSKAVHVDQSLLKDWIEFNVDLDFEEDPFMDYEWTRVLH